jgi:DNA-binding transcriptional LysR family regulator
VDPEQLPHLETFTRAAELGSFTAAATALGLTQAAVSQRIHTLEQALGVALFQRRAGRVSLSPAGQRLCPFAQRILALHREARAAVTGVEVPVAGELTLAASSVPGEHLLPAVLSVFRQRYPHIQVRAGIADTGAVLRQVEQGQAQLGLVGGRSGSPHLEFACFACDRMALVVPAGHPWASRDRVSLVELCQQPVILREAGSGSRWCLEQALTRAGVSPRDLQVALELGSNEAIKEAVHRGLGLAILSTHVVEKEVQAGQLHAVEVTGLDLEREIYTVHDRRRPLPIPVRLFLDLLGPCAKPAEGP